MIEEAEVAARVNLTQLPKPFEGGREDRARPTYLGAGDRQELGRRRDRVGVVLESRQDEPEQGQRAQQQTDGHDRCPCRLHG